MFKNILFLISGAAIGSAVTWKLVKTKYERLAQEEIDSMKEVYSKKHDEEEEEASENTEDADNRAKAEEAKHKASVSEYASRIQKHGYTNYSNPESISNDDEVEEDEQEEEMNRPYVIAPEDSGNEGYSIVSLTYYADKVLADENDELIEDVDELVGFESLNHFGEYEDDSVYVRNDRLRIDYEILLDQRTYPEARKGRPSTY